MRDKTTAGPIQQFIILAPDSFRRHNMPQPGISVITPTFNAAKTLEKCILSVARQNYPAIEHIIMDGNSTDETVALIRKLQKQFSHIRLFSEKDSGVYDAINHGMEQSKGEWLYFLGADDLLYNDTVLNDLAREGVFATERVIYGNVYVEGQTSWANDQAVYDGPFTLEKLLRKNICHQALFYPRSVIQTVGYFNTKYSTTADWDYNLRCFTRYEFFFVDRIIAFFHAGGISTDKTDDSITGDFPENLISYFGINPWNGEQYDRDSPFFYHMAQYREKAYQDRIKELIQKNSDLEDDLAKLQKSCLEKTNHLNAVISDLQEQVRSSQQKNKLLQDEQSDLLEQIKSLQLNIQGLQDEQSKMSRQNLFLTGELDRIRAKMGELNALIEERQNRIETILKSYTWKTGNLILAPLKYLSDHTKKNKGT